MSEQILSLFGWPMPMPKEKAGRPEHVPTDENRSKVMLLLAMRKTNEEIAKAIGVDPKTLRKHYSVLIEQRRVARLQLDATRWAMLYTEMIGGNVAAAKELGKVLDKHDLAELDDRVQARGGKTPKPPKMGKKEQQQLEAAEVDGIFAPPAAPRTVN